MDIEIEAEMNKKKLYSPSVGVKWPVELGRDVIIICCGVWLKTLIFDVALFIVVIDKPDELWLCPMMLLWSRGGDTGSDFTFTLIGDVEGGGVLFETAKCGKPLWERERKMVGF